MDFTVRIERMAYGPAGIGRLPDGKTIFVDSTVPGDTARVQIIEDKSRFARGRLVSLEEPSPHRVREHAPQETLCGTAPWQIMEYSAQLEAKRANVIGALTHGAGMDKAAAEELVAPVEAGKQQWNYRNKLELGAGTDSHGRFIVGFHREQSPQLVAVESSALAHKAIERTPKALRGAIRYAQGSRDLQIYRIGVRHSAITGDLEVALWTPPGAFPRSTFAKTIGEACKATGVIRVMADPGKARKIKGVEVLSGYSTWHEKLAGFDFHTQAPSFFQVNTAQAERLVALVREGLGNLEGALVADLFAGGGTFGIPLAAAGADVIAVEAAGSSVRDLRANAERNGVQLEVLGGDAARELAELGSLDALVVDPPRSGLGKDLVELIAGAAPRTLAYVSCDPATWARDIALLQAEGYRLKQATPVDMFPQTYHVEIVSILEDNR